MRRVRLWYWVGGLVVALTERPWRVDWTGVETTPRGPLLLLVLSCLVSGSASSERSVARGRRRLLLPSCCVPILPKADGWLSGPSLLWIRTQPNRVFPVSAGFSGSIRPPRRSPLKPLADRRDPSLLGRVVDLAVHRSRWYYLVRRRDRRSPDSVRRAGVWVEREAIRWNVPVNVDLADTYFAASDDEPDAVAIEFIPRGQTTSVRSKVFAVTKALTVMSRAAARLGFRDAQDLIARINPRVAADAARLAGPHAPGGTLARRPAPPDRTGRRQSGPLLHPRGEFPRTPSRSAPGSIP